jgi:hypothetical protein
MPKGTELHVGFFAPQSKHIYTGRVNAYSPPLHFEGLTLFAGFCFNLVKMFCDCVLVARAAMVQSGVEMRSCWAE